MQTTKSFYMTLDSSSNAKFPQNTPSVFQKRLPIVLNLTQPGWKVGLYSLYLPHVQEQSLSLRAIPDDTKIVSLRWIAKRSDTDRTEFLANIPRLQIMNETDGAMNQHDIMHMILDRYQYRKFTEARPDDQHIGRGDSEIVNLYRMDFTFAWLPNGNLLMDNTNTRLSSYTWTPSIAFHVMFASSMGWLNYEQGKGYKLGPNLKFSTLVYSEDY